MSNIYSEAQKLSAFRCYKKGWLLEDIADRLGIKVWEVIEILKMMNVIVKPLTEL